MFLKLLFVYLHWHTRALAYLFFSGANERYFPSSKCFLVSNTQVVTFTKVLQGKISFSSMPLFQVYVLY